MTTSATRRFLDLIGPERLEHGSRKSERGRLNGLGAVLNGKEATIISLLYPPTVFASPYPADSDYDHAFRSGALIERLDLTDVVRSYKL